MFRFVALMILLVACGGSDPTGTPTPMLPFLEPVEGDAIAILAPLDTTSGEHIPNSVLDAVDVPAGGTLLRWEAVGEADRYVLLLQDLGDLAGVAPGDHLDVETYAQFTVMETETSVLLELEPGTAQRTLVVQVFAYADRSLVGQSEAWAINVLSIGELSR